MEENFIITKEQLIDWLNGNNSLENIVLNRMSYIFKKIYHTFGRKFSTFYWSDAEEGETGSIKRAFTCDCVKDDRLVTRVVDVHGFVDGMVTEPRCDWEIMLNAKIYSIGGSYGFPIEWMYSDDFISELMKYSLLAMDEKAKRREVLAIIKAEKDARKQMLHDSIRSKLTPEELKCIKFKP